MSGTPRGPPEPDYHPHHPHSHPSPNHPHSIGIGGQPSGTYYPGPSPQHHPDFHPHQGFPANLAGYPYQHGYHPSASYQVPNGVVDRHQLPSGSAPVPYLNQANQPPYFDQATNHQQSVQQPIRVDGYGNPITPAFETAPHSFSGPGLPPTFDQQAQSWQPQAAYSAQFQQQPQQQQQQIPPQPLVPTPPSDPVPTEQPHLEADSPSTATLSHPKIILRLNKPSGDMPSRSRRGVKEEATTPVADRPRRGRAAKQVNYNEDEDDGDFQDEPEEEEEDDDDAEDEPEPPVVSRPARGGRRATRRTVVEEDEDADGEAEFEPPAPAPAATEPTRRSSRSSKVPERYADDDDFENNMLDTSPVIQEVGTTRKTRRRIVDPDDEDADAPVNGTEEPVLDTAPDDTPVPQRKRQPSRQRHSSADAESFAPTESDQSSEPESPDEVVDDYEEQDDDDNFLDDSPPRRRPTRRATRSSVRATRSTRAMDSDDSYGAKRTLRKRASRPNYELPPMDISAEIQAAEIMNNAIAAASRPGGARRGGGFPGAGAANFGAAVSGKTLPWSLKGKDFAQAMGDPDSSDSDMDLPALGAGGGAAAAAGGGAVGGPSGMPGRTAGPSDVPNFGRVNPKSNMADADPLGVDVNVTFDRVGGLDNHINQLKEMVALPLLYPELFQQFGIIPPRGVLFHGPPGTGKTLLARALAASCSNGNTKISFFMRKGADVLSKWVGEAERQLRMLFEEARASQPSIIFFDEIDGLAPVRSSKQDQIHASLVSTLLALMDGMDGRGQVIVIGATNRPDAVDPALRRPGRFDREFYFPLPNIEARKQIIKINTREWDPQLPEPMLDKLATLTKGYGGSDLRALCTEAALNAIQRRYPQIYKSTDRLQVQPGSVRVQPKDFMLAVNTAAQLPPQLVPLLSESLEGIKRAVDLALPPVKKRTALEEAEFEDDDGDTFEKELMLQCFHVQSFDIATLMSDSTRTPEAAVVQLFVEAKRHQPSVIFIPSLAQWAHTISDAARSTTRALLDSIPPSDPVLLLAIVDGPLSSIPSDVRKWFGIGDESRIEIGKPSADQREKFFSELLDSVQRPPNEFPDGVPRKKRVLEILPPAEPLPPRKPTEAEVQRELERDAAARNMLFVSFSSLIAEFMRKYRRPASIVKEEAFAHAAWQAEQAALNANPPQTPPPAAAPIVPPVEAVNGEVTMEPATIENAAAETQPAGTVVVEAATTEVPTIPAVMITSACGDVSTAAPTEAGDLQQEQAVATVAKPWEAHNIDIDIIQRKLVKHKYFTPDDVLADIALIEDNANHTMDADRQLKISEMAAHARMHVQSFDPKWIPEFAHYGERMRQRKAERAKAKAAREAEKAKEQEKANGEAEAVGENGEAAPGPQIEGEAASLKRPREEGEDDNGPAKRPRDDAMDVDPATEAALETANEIAATVEPIGGVDPTVAISAEPAATNGSPAKEPTPAPKEPTPAPKEPTPVNSPSPPPVYPPLEVPDLSALRAALRDDTGLLTVEELEQLRAALLDRVWRSRQSWDRAPLVEGLEKFVRRYLDEVKLDREEEYE
ncbi:TAT-binding protein [Trichosporon asahii var. asahii CBS 2479]|uniref:TAT-binding protein n=1 Tax=Trichosporon asahii var. asahii (strain ATCC 90039 / CBS 2479 / JCM 2466 / KCTC 7840 / NBRC 103889/ NCYC 2677 / UAMH 7654) TaxID=1186058 RepID=J6EWH2_TRIAS|nr:TAT-binding protein [Trichosporon asahii var. asahii CBS 2479]EJT48969.1 TAT-binding protein [Trichosporon asahii var. asahii CBS 2479]